METGSRELVEASKTDRMWGVGFSVKKAGDHRDQWGENLLGKALMCVRERIHGEKRKEIVWAGDNCDCENWPCWCYI